jgi:hypothetical protein
MSDLTRAETSSSPEVLAELARGGTDHIRRVVAMNRTCPPEVLAKLAQDKRKEVRKAAIKNRSCPAHIRTIGALAE